MLKTLLTTTAAIVAFSGVAMAQVDCGNFAACSDNDTVNNSGGAGGAGGTGIGVGLGGAGGSAAQQQGQQQGQAQGQIAAQGQAQDASNSNSISISGDNYEAAVSSPYAPALAAGVNPCALSYSGGVSAMDFGFALGGVVNSDTCEKNAQIATLLGMGEREAAVALACSGSDKMAVAMRKAKRCPVSADEDAIAMGAYDVGPTRSAELDENDFGYTPARLGGGKLSRK